MADQRTTGYRNPLTGVKFTSGRTDQGWDIEAGGGNVGAGIRAIGDGVVKVAQPVQGYGPSYLVYELTSGPMKGHAVFIGHSIATVQAGDKVSAGQVIAKVRGGPGYGGAYGHIEMGWADPSSPWGAPLGHAHKDPQTHYTPEGADFKTFLTALISSAPSGTPALPTDAASTASTPPAATDTTAAAPSATMPNQPVSSAAGRLPGQPPMVAAGVQGALALPGSVDLPATDFNPAESWQIVANSALSSPEAQQRAQVRAGIGDIGGSF